MDPPQVTMLREGSTGEQASGAKARSSASVPPGSGAMHELMGDPTLTGGDEPRGSTGARWARGSPIGRYIVLDELGAGGMGVVYAAYDPELDRKVAIKMILPTPSADEGRTDGRMRLVREAQAMARISHPNIVHVHDVGTAEETVFVAMELVDGQTLKRWLLLEPPLREILQVFMQAGRGLAAAHAVDLIHRDFKPDNVLIDRSGGVRVVDFGLARRTDATHALSDSARVSTSRLDVDLTATGSVMGTPAYMAPEQHAGKTADARSDQFSFCVALYEAVYGERPFAGDRHVVLAASVLAGEVRPPPTGHNVPGWLRKILLRGLAVSPEERYPSMDALMRDLSRDVFRSRRRWLLGAGMVSLVGALAVSAFSAGRSRSRIDCDPDDIIDPLWNGERRALLAGAFAASGAVDSAGAWTRAESRIDRYIGRWRRAYAEACEATHVHGTQSPETLELRHGCLAHALQYLDTSLDVLAEANPKRVEQTADMLDRIPSPQSCARPYVAPATLPDDPVARAAIEAVEAELIRADMLDEAHETDSALNAAEHALAQAEALGHGPTIASALILISNLRNDAAPLDEDLLYRALSLALASGDDRVAARASATMSSSLVFASSSLQEALRWGDVAQALVDRAGDLPMEQRIVDNARAVTWSQLGRTRDAQAIFEKILAQQRAEPEPTTGLLDALLNLGALHGNANELAEARAHLEEALEVGIELHGPLDRRLTRTYGNLANIALMESRLDDAESLLERALAVERARERSSTLAETLATFGVLRRRQGNAVEAEQLYREALDVYEATVGLQHPKALELMRNMAIAISHQGREDDARDLVERAVSLADPRFLGPQELVRLYSAAGELWVEADPERARAHAERALQVLEDDGGQSDVLFIDPLRLLGRSLRALERLEESAMALERAVELADKVTVTGLRRAKAHWDLARTLAASGQDARALELARSAFESLPEPRGPDEARLAATLESWLAENEQ